MVQADQTVTTNIISLFEFSAGRFGDSAAVQDWKHSLTYQQLKEQTDECAARLSDLGMPQRGVVGVYMDRSIEYIVVILSVLKAGMIFMPLSTAFPAGRLTTILKKTRPRLLVVDEINENDLRQKIQYENIMVFSEEFKDEPTFSHSKNNLRPDPDAHSTPWRNNDHHSDAAYIITTSGSTGEPKAILGSHKGLVHFINWETMEFGFSQDCRVSQLSPVSFDVSLRDIFAPLAVGGCVCIPDNNTIQNPSELLRWMRNQRITITHMVPTLFRMLTKALIDENALRPALPDLEYVILAGEPVYGGDIAKWRQAAGQQSKIVNFYGPSETTLAKLYHRIETPIPGMKEMVPIGKPIPQTSVFIIDDGKACKIGEPGELYIKTPYMSLGYYRDAELTQNSFIQNPIRDDATEIVYKTGDQGELLPDGSIRFLGWVDGLVKMYGRRIELGEIEVFLRQHPDVKDAAAAVREDTAGNPRLVAYVVPEAGQKPSVERLRRFLADKLPDYMVPQTYVHLDKLPVTHNGKVDRNALPALGRGRPELETNYVPPANAMEQILCGIWGKVLNLDKVGTRDGFFDLGGTSVLAARLIEQLRDVLKVDLAIVTLFQYPQVSLLAAFLQGNQNAQKPHMEAEERARQRRAQNRPRKR